MYRVADEVIRSTDSTPNLQCVFAHAHCSADSEHREVQCGLMPQVRGFARKSRLIAIVCDHSLIVTDDFIEA